MEAQHEAQGRSSPTGRAGFSSDAAAAKHSLIRSRSDQDAALIARGSPASEPEMESATKKDYFPADGGRGGSNDTCDTDDIGAGG